MQLVEPLVEYKVFYNLDPDYKGTYLVDKLTKRGLHGTFGGEETGKEDAIKAAHRCYKYFSEQNIPVEKVDSKSKVTIEIRTVKHNNVVVWIEKYIDGFPTKEEIPWNESQKRKKEPELATA